VGEKPEIITHSKTYPDRAIIDSKRPNPIAHSR